MEKKFSWLLALLVPMMSFVMISCGDEDDNIGGETYYYFGEYKNTVIVRTDRAEVYFYPENEDAIREDLSRHNLTLSDVGKYLVTYRLDEYTEAGQTLYENLMRGTINGEYKKYKSALKHTVAWSPYYKQPYTHEEPSPAMSFTAATKPDVDYQKVAKLVEENNVIITLVDDTDPSFTGYVFACTNESKKKAVEMSVVFYHSGLFETATPHFGTIHELYN